MGRGKGGNDALCTGNDLDWHSIHLNEWMRNVDERRVNLYHTLLDRDTTHCIIRVFRHYLHAIHSLWISLNNIVS